jgi:hypothetical protein
MANAAPHGSAEAGIYSAGSSSGWQTIGGYFRRHMEGGHPTYHGGLIQLGTGSQGFSTTGSAGKSLSTGLTGCGEQESAFRKTKITTGRGGGSEAQGECGG